MNGTTREAAQELGGWKAPAAMTAAYNETRTGEVSPEMGAAVAEARAVLDVTPFIGDRDRDARPDGDGALGSDCGAQVRVSFHRIFSLKEYLAPIVLPPARENFRSLMGRRVRLLDSSDSQGRAILSWGAEFSAASRVYGSSDPRSAVQMLRSCSVVGAGVEKRPLRM